jgi:hypothetical protein
MIWLESILLKSIRVKIKTWAALVNSTTYFLNVISYIEKKKEKIKFKILKPANSNSAAKK